MLMFGLIFFGFLCFSGMGLSEMPDIAFPVVNVSITLPNASALVMESDVADVVEDSVLGVEGVQDVQTTCTQGNVSISVFLDISQNVDVAVAEVQTAVFQVGFAGVNLGRMDFVVRDGAKLACSGLPVPVRA